MKLYVYMYASNCLQETVLKDSQPYGYVRFDSYYNSILESLETERLRIFLPF